MKWFGIDPGLSAVGVAYVDSFPRVDLAFETFCLNPKTRDEERLCEIENYVFGLLERHRADVDIVALEGYSYASRNCAHQMGEVGGMIRKRLWTDGYRYVVVSPSQLKKFVAGKGSAKKDEMRLWVFKRWGVECPTEHQIDSFCCAMLAKECYNLVQGHSEGLSQCQREVVASIVPKRLGGESLRAGGAQVRPSESSVQKKRKERSQKPTQGEDGTTLLRQEVC